MITIAVANQKGGVGKTTIAFNFAYSLSNRRNTKVLAVDNDPQGNLTSSFIETTIEFNANILNAYDANPFKPFQISKSLYLLGSDISLAPVAERDFQVIFKLQENLRGLISDQNAGRFNYVIIDCLPSFGYLHMAALNAADKVLIPIKPAPFAIAGLKDLFETIEKTKKRLNQGLEILGIILNLVEGKQTTMGGELEDVLREKYSNLVFETRITKGVKLEESPSFLQSIMEYDPKGKQTQQFNKFINEFLKRL